MRTYLKTRLAYLQAKQAYLRASLA